jgi:hypothetical protein
MDFVFVPQAWTIDAVEVGSFEDYVSAGLSDHVPLIVTVGAVESSAVVDHKEWGGAK